MNHNEQPNFFDARTITALVLVALTFFGWNWYMQKKYPDAFKPKEVAVEGADKPVKPLPEPATAKAAPDSVPETAARAADEKIEHFESEDIAFDISSRGMGVKNFQLKKYRDRAGNLIHLGYHGEKSLPFETRLRTQTEPLDFTLTRASDRVFVGRATVGGVEITKTVEVQPEVYLLKHSIVVKGSDPRFVGLTTVLSEDVEPIASGSFLLPTLDLQEFYLDLKDTNERYVFEETDHQASWSQVKVASVGSQYFTQAVLDKSDVMPEAKGNVAHAGKLASLLLEYPMQGEGAKIEYLGFMGPKSHYLLTQIDKNLAHVVNFGYFNWIGRQILAMLHWFFALIGNWGVAIILLTIVVRILVLPFNVYSYKSMKKMQDIQPRIQSLRERYKDDQQKQQKELMALMRDNKVNPLGGCLPVLLQFPIFIALYQVLGNSIELYQAPLGLWIHDLSLKDPYYILPVLMGVTMFIQQKITPNTMDPAQAKVMLIMPLIFTVFMVSLPSGLTLYMWVGAIFSVLQQLYFLRDSKPLQKT